jgi:hypothetical protein
MGHHLSPRHWLAATAVIGAVLATGTGIPAAAGPAAPGPVPPGAARARPPASLLLIDGERLLARPGPGGATGWTLPRTAGQQPLIGLPVAGRTEEIPAGALPYLGHGLDPSLFDLAALERAESGGRLPVRVTFTGHRPALPGMTVTGAGRRSERGYLTTAGARAFGAALARQFRADYPRASYGGGGLFASGTDIALAGAPAPAPAQPRHAGTTDTLTMAGTNLADKPDTGASVDVINADDARLFDAVGHFHDGAATFHVPAGHYWAIGIFGAPDSALRLVILPQFTVHGTRTVPVAERAADSEISFATPRPAVPELSWFVLWRGGAKGPRLVLATLLSAPVWVSPATRPVTVGTLRTYTEGWLVSPPGAKGTPYEYNLDFAGPPGILPAQHWAPAPGSLTTVDNRDHADVPSRGLWATTGGFAGQLLLGRSLSLPGIPFAESPLPLPGRQVQYLSGGPAIGWSRYLVEFAAESGAGQGDGQQSGPMGPTFGPLPAGRHLTVDWNAYPLHPQPDTQPERGAIATMYPTFPTAFRHRNALVIYVSPFSDNYPGHLGSPDAGALHGTRVTGSYAIYQNGKLVAHGKPVGDGSSPSEFPIVQISPGASMIRFVYSVGRFGSRFPLSPASRTVWAWRSAPRPLTPLPRGWVCFNSQGFYPRSCAVQPMMTLDYHVAGMALDGRARAGQQVIGLDVGHIRPGPQPRVIGAAAKVSFDGGHTWQPATVTAQRGGHFRITFRAPAGADVTLQIHATDAADGSVTETIQQPYGIAS